MIPFFHLRPKDWMAVIAIAGAAMPFALNGQVTGTGTYPNYTAQGVVNAATQTAEALAPNALATLYGTNLAFDTQAVSAANIVQGMMPTTLDGVGVWINSLPCSLFYVSPGQINFLVPYQLTAGTVSLIIARDGQAGPTVTIQLNNTSPGLFLWTGNDAIAAHLNGQLISAGAPAAPGEVVVIFAAGLGRTSPDTKSGQLATSAFPIYYMSQLQVLFNGLPSPPGSILYAGLAPGFAGLYQINVTLPAGLTANPEVQIAIGPQISPLSIQLAVQPAVVSQ